MTTIILTNSEKATDASHWAVDNIAFDDWEIKLESLFVDTQYHFRFTHKEDAVRFALRWI